MFASREIGLSRVLPGSRWISRTGLLWLGLTASCGGSGYSGGAGGYDLPLAGYKVSEDVRAVYFEQNDGDFAFLDLSGLATPIFPLPEDVMEWAAQATRNDPRYFTLPPSTTLPMVEGYFRLDKGAERLAVLRIASACGTPRMIPKLGEVLSSGQAWERNAAAYALGSLGGSEAAGILREQILIEESADVLMTLYQSLGRGGTDGDAAFLEARKSMAAGDEIEGVIEDAIALLETRAGELPGQKVARLVAELDYDALNHVEPEATPHLVALVRDRSEDGLARLVAIHRTFQVGSAQDRIDLSEIAFEETEDPVLRIAVIEGITYSRMDGMKFSLQNILAYEIAAALRVAALRALAVLGDRGSQPLVLEAMDDPDREVRREAARTLAYLSDAPNENYLRNVIDSGNYFLRDGWVVYRTYNIIRAEEAVIDLERIATDVFVPPVPRGCAILLLGLSRQSDAVPLLDHLIRKAFDDDILVRRVAARASGYHQDLRLRDALEEVVSNPESHPFDLVATCQQVLSEF